MIVKPSILSSTVLWPSQAACSPRSGHLLGSGILGGVAMGRLNSRVYCCQNPGAALYTRAPVPTSPIPPVLSSALRAQRRFSGTGIMTSRTAPLSLCRCSRDIRSFQDSGWSSGARLHFLLRCPGDLHKILFPRRRARERQDIHRTDRHADPATDAGAVDVVELFLLKSETHHVNADLAIPRAIAARDAL